MDNADPRSAQALPTEQDAARCVRPADEDLPHVQAGLAEAGVAKEWIGHPNAIRPRGPVAARRRDLPYRLFWHRKAPFSGRWLLGRSRLILRRALDAGTWSQLVTLLDGARQR